MLASDEFRMKPKGRISSPCYKVIKPPSQFTTVIYSKGVTFRDILTVLLKGIAVLMTPLFIGYEMIPYQENIDM